MSSVSDFEGGRSGEGVVAAGGYRARVDKRGEEFVRQEGVCIHRPDFYGEAGSTGGYRAQFDLYAVYQVAAACCSCLEVLCESTGGGAAVGLTYIAEQHYLAGLRCSRFGTWRQEHKCGGQDDQREYGDQAKRCEALPGLMLSR